MNVCVRILFEAPGPDALASMRSLARSLTDDPDHVRVFADADPQWLVAEFTMPTEAQYRALPKIEAAIRYHAWRRLDSTIAFPMSAAERARADRRAAQRRNRRRRSP
jgi:hypothetical protein